MATLNIDTVELVSSLRTVGLNGAPSSQDYNDSQREYLEDLASLANTVNSFIIPLLNYLNSVDSQGEDLVLNGDTLFASSNLASALFNSTDGPLTISQVFSKVQSILTSQQTTVTALAARVSALSTQLASTNQDDIAKAISGYSSQLQSFFNQVNTLAANFASVQATAQADASAIAAQNTKLSTMQTTIDGIVNGTIGTAGGGGTGTGTGPTVIPYDIFIPVAGQPLASQVVYQAVFVRSVIFGSNFSGSVALATTAPTSNAVFSITRNGSQVGTLTFAPSGAYTFSSLGFTSVSFSAGDVLGLVSPYPQDATLADLSVTLTSTVTSSVSGSGRLTGPYDIFCQISGQPLGGQVMIDRIIPRSITFSGSFTGSQAVCGGNPTGTAAVFSIQKNNVQVGTISFSTAGVATFASTNGAAVVFNIGDRLTIVSPNTQNATLYDVTTTLTATLN
jgi:hypothetical protein